MSEHPFTCVKCGNTMVKGFAADKSEVYHIPLLWVDGEPVQASLFGIKGDNLNLGNSEKRTVRGLRCQKCGYLELYAV